MTIYRNAITRDRLLKERPDIIWPIHNLDREIAEFRAIYTSWCEKHPDNVKLKSNKSPMTAEDYIEMLVNHVDELQTIEETLNWPWRWCIDSESFGGEFFLPSAAIIGDSRILMLDRDELHLKGVNQEITKGRNAKESTRLNDRYRLKNPYFGNGNSSTSVERWVANYFCKKPETEFDLEAGHKIPFDKNLDCITNNNINNVGWQTIGENHGIQRRFDNGNGAIVLKEEAKAEDKVLEIEPSVASLLSIKKTNDWLKSQHKAPIDVCYERKKDENGYTEEITIKQGRGIVPVKKESEN